MGAQTPAEPRPITASFRFAGIGVLSVLITTPALCDAR